MSVMDKKDWYTKEDKNDYDLVNKEIKRKFKTNNPTNEQIKKYKRHGLELIDGEIFVYAHEDIIIPVIRHYRTPESCKLQRSLGLKLHNVINCKEQTLLESIKYAFEGENMQTQYSVLGYKIDLYFHEHKLEVDELGHNDKNSDYKIQKQRAIEEEIGCVFIRINLDEENFGFFKVMNHLNTLIDKSSNRLLKLEFKLNHS